MTSIRTVMSPEFMAGNCLAALQAHGLATREEKRSREGWIECKSAVRHPVNLNDQQVMEVWLETTLLEHGGASMNDILVWASVSKAWRFRILARQPQIRALMGPEEPAFQETDLPPCGNSVLRDLDLALTDAIRDHRGIFANLTLNVQALTRVTECIAALRLEQPVFPEQQAQALLMHYQNEPLWTGFGFEGGGGGGGGVYYQAVTDEGHEFESRLSRHFLQTLAKKRLADWQSMMCKLEGDGLVWETLCPIIRRGRARVLVRLLHSLQHALRRADLRSVFS